MRIRTSGRGLRFKRFLQDYGALMSVFFTDCCLYIKTMATKEETHTIKWLINLTSRITSLDYHRSVCFAGLCVNTFSVCGYVRQYRICVGLGVYVYNQWEQRLQAGLNLLLIIVSAVKKR